MTIAGFIFLALLLAAGGLFFVQVKKIRRNILLGKDVDRSDNAKDRWKTMAMVAMGQSKMTKRPVAGILHIIVYVGFVIINIEVLEIIIDGVFGTHRVFAGLLGGFYTMLIASFEVLAFLVFVACLIFFIRRNVLKIKRFMNKEMDGWPRSDANIILGVEMLLMFAFLYMNAADNVLMHADVFFMQEAGVSSHYWHTTVNEAAFPISQFLVGLVPTDLAMAEMTERGAWWFHIIGILAFLNYLPISKHFHILLAFPNTYYSNLKAKGAMTNMESVKKEVELMMDPNADPYAAAPAAEEAMPSFGAKDVQDLTWKQLMDSYSCTECGRCTSNCPANQTGKLLSPRKIMMDTRDRLTEVGKNIDANKGEFKPDGKTLINDYITEEEVWACTSCNACTEACPVNIDPLSIILELRRSLVMEESKVPSELTTMFNNVENNGAPWAFAPSDRMKWADEL